MECLARLLRETEDEHSSRLRTALFGTRDADNVASEVAEFVAASLAPVRTALFARSGVGLVVGAVLVDGREVAVKVHRWNVTIDRLAAVQEVQASLAGRGLPAPRPLAAPRPIGRALGTIEDLRSGERADGHDPQVVQAIAWGLADFIRAAAIEPRPRVGRGFLTPTTAGGPLWGEPHDLRFDFQATAQGAEWIDESAHQARSVLVEIELPEVIAHLDWRAENLAFRGHEIVAIYDWDSVATASEAVAVGHAAAQFSSDWAHAGAASLPSVDEMRSFVTAYEDRRGRPFDDVERQALNAANLMLCAYGARCQHSDRFFHPQLAGPPNSGWTALLRQRGLDGLL